MTDAPRTLSEINLQQYPHLVVFVMIESCDTLEYPCAIRYRASATAKKRMMFEMNRLYTTSVSFFARKTRSGREGRDRPISESNSPIVRCLLQRIVPAYGCVIIRPRLQDDKLFLDVPAQEREKRNRGEEDIRHKRIHYRRKRDSNSSNQSIVSIFPHIPHMGHCPCPSRTLDPLLLPAHYLAVRNLIIKRGR
jgi:hypothetical protein